MATAPKPPAAFSARELAQRPEIDAAMRWFARERGWINDRHLQICRIAAPTFFEATRAAWLRDEFAALGWDSRIDRAGNVIANWPGATGPFLAVSAHLDTVFAPSKPEEITVVAGGRFTGPGVSDNGAGLAALLALARLLASEERLRYIAASVLLIANVGEEGEGNLSGMRYICRDGGDSESILAFLILDGPAVDHITAQALASRRFEVTFTGPGGHTWNDNGVPNPIHAASEAITAFITEAESRLEGKQRGSAAYNFSVIEGGTSVNSIPAQARAKLDIRAEDPALLDMLASPLTPCVERALEKVNRLARIGKLSAKVRDLGSRPGGQLTGDEPLIRAVKAADAHLGIRSRVTCASTDANVPLSLGLEALSIGAGGAGGGAHTLQEWYQPDRREAGLARILLTISYWLENRS